MINVYIAENCLLTKLGLLALLEKTEGMQVVGSFCSKSGAIEAPESGKADLLISSPDLLLKVRNSNCSLAELPAVVFTDRDDERSIFSCLEARTNAYVLNDDCSRSLIYAIHAVAQGRFWLDPRITGLIIQAALRRAASNWPAYYGCDNVTPFPAMSVREQEVLTLVAEGLGNLEIANRLTISPETVKTHLRHVMGKMKAKTRIEAAVKSVAFKLLQAEC